MLNFRNYKQLTVDNEDPYALWNPLLSPSTEVTPVVDDEPEYECRICLETPTDPCVTRCGHLYCLGCLRQWLDFSPKCPACKSPAHISQVVPIFGVSGSSSPRTTAVQGSNKQAPHPNRSPASSSSGSSLASSSYPSTSGNSKRASYTRDQRRQSTSSSASAASSLLLSSPRPFQFTSEPSPTTIHREEGADDDDAWDTDDELEFQLSQMPPIKLPQALSGASANDADAGSSRQPFGRAVSVVALAVMLTVLLK